MSSKSPKYVKMINSGRWTALRQWKLQQQPYCEECLKQGIYTPASCVHHIEPVEDCFTESEMELRMFTPSNLASLCRDCHHTIHNTEGYHKKEMVRKRQEERVKRSIDRYFGQ